MAVTYWTGPLFESYRGKGYATEMILMGLRFFFWNFLIKIKYNGLRNIIFA